MKTVINHIEQTVNTLHVFIYQKYIPHLVQKNSKDIEGYFSFDKSQALTPHALRISAENILFYITPLDARLLLLKANLNTLHHIEHYLLKPQKEKNRIHNKNYCSYTHLFSAFSEEDALTLFKKLPPEHIFWNLLLDEQSPLSKIASLYRSNQPHNCVTLT